MELIFSHAIVWMVLLNRNVKIVSFEIILYCMLWVGKGLNGINFSLFTSLIYGLSIL